MVRAGRGQGSWYLWLFPLAILIALVSWAMTSPVGSSPDDDYHLASIWCSGGERSGVCEVDPTNSDVRLVPEIVGFGHECFAFHEATTAACATSVGSELVATDRVNTVQGLYPTGFYAAMGVFIGKDVDRSVLMMRGANAFIFVALLALAVVVLSPAIRSSISIVVVVLFVPLGLFIIPSTNPSSWTLTGITFLWAFGLALAQRVSWRSRRTWLLALATVASTGLAIGSRVDAAAYVALTVVVILLLSGVEGLRKSWISTLVLLGIATVGLLQYMNFGTPGSGVSGGMGSADPGPGLLLTNIAYLPVYLSGAVGGTAIGWNDTFLPPSTFVFGLLVLGALVFRGVSAIPRAKALASGVALVALVLVPLIFLQREGLGAGEVVQARYLLPLMAVLFLTLSLAVPYGTSADRGLPMPGSMAWIVFLLMSGTAGLSLWVNAHRYASGSERGLFDLDLVMEWTGITELPLPLVVAVGVLATVTYVGAAVRGVVLDGSRIEASTGRTGSRTTAFRLAR